MKHIYLEKSQSRVIIALLVAMIIGYIAYVGCTQTVIGKSDGYGWDGVFYHASYEHFKGNGADSFHGKDVSGIYDVLYQNGEPFNKRAVVPYVASKLPMNEFASFRLINLLCFFAGMIFLFLKWYKRSMMVALLFLLYILITPQVPFRFALFYPINVDGALFLYVALMVFFYEKPLAVLLLSLLFIPVKETAVPISALYFISLAVGRKSIRPLLYIGVMGAVYYLFLKMGGKQLGFNNQVSGVGVLLDFIKRNIFKPSFYIKTVACTAIVFSTFLLMKRQLTARTLFFLLLWGLLIFSGTDTTRILCCAIPFLLDELMETKVNENLLWLFGSFLLILPLKFPWLTLQFSDNDVIGDGFFVTQFEYLSSKTNLLFIGYFILVTLVLFQLNKRFRLVKS